MHKFGIDLQQLEAEMVRAAVFQLSISLIVLILLFWATYWVIKAGVRDGIREANPMQRSGGHPTAPPGYRWTLTKDVANAEDMRAD
ncbi:hypothetical protein [Acidovorax sp. sic0104]|uniref:hypothetical protein n=1 Tax=Acidovorax sp. sic0104 TaxID=2854784 RepID=UPI001C44D258|nr:hypothetical protein [Acidovorax sp. sic0104]MBV7540003.1 hypothetical protein [Acidovorax sp. sic0104]